MKCNVLIYLILLQSYLGHAQVHKADSLVNIGAYGRAITFYQQLPENAKQQFKIARAYHLLGATKKAILSYEKGLALDSTSVLPRFEYGKLLIITQRYDDAHDIFHRLTMQEPTTAAYHFYMGKAFTELQQYKPAQKAFSKAIELNPEYRAAHLQLVKSYIQSKSYVVATLTASTYLEQTPDDYKMLSYHVQACLKAKLFSRAIPSLEKLIQAGKLTDFNVKNLGLAYLNDAQYKNALEYFDLYIKDFDDANSAIHFQRAMAIMKLERYDEALEAMETSISIKSPPLTQEYLQMSAIHARNNDLSKAFKALQKAKQESPNSPMIDFQLALAADRFMKDQQSIINYYQAYIDKHGEESTYGEQVTARLSDLKKTQFMEAKQQN
jgi:tetratricopeptide (TPR) repeat protein